MAGDALITPAAIFVGKVSAYETHRAGDARIQAAGAGAAEMLWRGWIGRLRAGLEFGPGVRGRRGRWAQRESRIWLSFMESPTTRNLARLRRALW